MTHSYNVFQWYLRFLKLQVRPGYLVYDPFVGTGSVLLSCARFGAHTAGGDIDKTLLHGRGDKYHRSLHVFLVLSLP